MGGRPASTRRWWKTLLVLLLGWSLLPFAADDAGGQTPLISVSVSPSTVVVGNYVNVTGSLAPGWGWGNPVTFSIIDPRGAVRDSVSRAPVAGDNTALLRVPSGAPVGTYRARVCSDVWVIIFGPGSGSDAESSSVPIAAYTCGETTFSVVPVTVTISANDVIAGNTVTATVNSNTTAGVRARLVGPGYASAIQSGIVSPRSTPSFSFGTSGLSPGGYAVEACLGPLEFNSCEPGPYSQGVVVNCVPVVRNAAFETLQGQAVSVGLASVLSSGCSPIGPVMDVRGGPSNGRVVSEGGSLVYTPNPGFAGVDSFRVQVCVSRPGVCAAEDAVVSVTVNNPPTASDTQLSVVSNGTVSFDVTGFSSDPDGSVVGWLTTQGPGFGSLSNSGATAGSFTAPGGRCGESTSFTFVVTDDAGAQSNTATATVTVVGCPSASPVRFDGVAGQAVSFRVAGSDPDGSLASWEVVRRPGLGEVRVGAGISGSYTAPEGSCGEQTSFDFRVVDNDGSVSDVATARIDIVGCLSLVDDQAEDGDGGLATIDVLANDDYPGGVDPDALTIPTQPEHGSASVVDGKLEYIADPDFQGVDEFAYEGCDLFGQCDTATVAVDVAFECVALAPGTVTIEPATANAGDDVDVIVVVPAAGVDARCESLSVDLTFDGDPWGEEVVLERTRLEGAAGGQLGARSFAPFGFLPQVDRPEVFAGTVSLQVPSGLVPGDYEVGVVDAGSGEPVGEAILAIPEIPVTTSTVAAAPEAEVDDESTPIQGEPGSAGLWGSLVAAGVLAGGGVVWALGRRRNAHAGDPCPGERELLEQTESEVEAARSRLEGAESRLDGARARLAELESELSGCVAESRAGVAPMVPLQRSGGDAAVDVESYRLAEVSNPNAPLAQGGVRGWWYPRTDPIGSVSMCSIGQVGIDPTLATDDMIDAVGLVDRPFAAHVLVSAAEVSRLLPNDVSVLGVGEPSALVVAVVDPDDPRVLEQAAHVVARLMEQHALVRESVSAAEIDGVSCEIDTERLLDLAGQQREHLVGAVPFPALGTDDPCAELRTRAQAQRSETETIQGEVADARAELEAAEARAAESSESLRECECRPVPVAGTPEEAAEEDDADESKWFLLKHQNPNAPLRANEKRGWYYPSREQPISGIVVHTAEAASGPGTALYLSKVRRPASAHVIADATGIIKLLPDSYTAFHAAGGNRRGLGIEIEYFADRWGSNAVLEETLLASAVGWCAMKATAYGIPAVRLTADQWAAGERGFVAHGDLDPGRRTDPGHNFPWDEFLERVGAFGVGGLERD